MASAIDAIVDAYVSTGNISALEAMKAHRAALLADTTDRDGFSFAVVRSTIEGDIAAIDTALLKLRPANPASPDATSDD